jgi:uncharacterized protein (DUF427 family)
MGRAIGPASRRLPGDARSDLRLEGCRVTRVPTWAQQGRAKWRWTGAARPEFAAAAGPGQESVWDYPRPPRLERDARVVEVRAGGALVARTERAFRVLETASPPTFYLPRSDVAAELAPVPGGSRCEWKGEARYWDVRAGDACEARAAWSYPDPFEEFAPLAGYLSFHPARFECTVGGVVARPQPGGFYGGWVTPELAGPFKGEPGSEGW